MTDKKPETEATQITDNKKPNVKEIDYLDEDPVIQGQEWICVSFLSPEGIMNCKIRGIKFRGAFPTYEAAKKHADKINKTMDPDFHIYVGQGFKWLPWNPDPNDTTAVQDQVYKEKELNKLMKAYKQNLQKKDQMERERKKDLMQRKEAVESPTTGDPIHQNKTRDRLKKKLAEKNAKASQDKPKEHIGMVDPEEAEKELEEKETKSKIKVKENPNIKKMEEELHTDKAKYESAQSIVINDEKKLDEAKKEINEIDQNLAKLQDLYKKMTTKK